MPPERRRVSITLKFSTCTKEISLFDFIRGVMTGTREWAHDFEIQRGLGSRPNPETLKPQGGIVIA